MFLFTVYGHWIRQYQMSSTTNEKQKTTLICKIFTFVWVFNFHDCFQFSVFTICGYSGHAHFIWPLNSTVGQIGEYEINLNIYTLYHQSKWALCESRKIVRLSWLIWNAMVNRLNIKWRRRSENKKKKQKCVRHHCDHKLNIQNMRIESNWMNERMHISNWKTEIKYFFMFCCCFSLLKSILSDLMMQVIWL